MKLILKQMMVSGLLGVCSLFPMQLSARDVIVKHGNLQICYTEVAKSFDVKYKGKDKNPVTLLCGSVPEATYSLGRGETRQVNATQFAVSDYRKYKVSDNVGQGVCHEFVFSAPANGDAVQLRQSFYAYEGTDYVLTRLALTGEDDGMASNYLAPVMVKEGYDLFAPAGTNRVLCVPFDNDRFVRYHKNRLDGKMTSYEVSALYEGESRFGLVLGSVEHNRWKSAVEVEASGDGRIERLKVFSGVSDDNTRDVLPHGKVKGTSVASALMFIGAYTDWRDGMEVYARANTKVQPMRHTWTRGAPFGWQSWGVMAGKNSYDVDVAVSDYFRDTLQPGGFCNDRGWNIMSIDAWDNMSHDQRREFTAKVEANGQIPGSYVTPFCLWWNEDMLNRRVPGSRFTGWDCVLRVKGKPYKLDGAYCLDPTHPGTKEMMRHEVQMKKTEGFRYLKVDFTSNGMVQADSYYNKNVTTAVEAYNEGFSWFLQQVDEGEPMFIALSIAPIFPYQYGNSRRIACDTWGKIGQSEYSMNSVCGGWWTNEFYQYNDPDHLVLVGNDQEKETEGENRARLTNGMSSGMVLVSDNFSLEDKSGCGDAVLSRQRARKFLMNEDVNELGRFGRSARPVFGYREYNGKADAAESCVMLDTEKYLYVSVINYGENTLTGTIPFERLGIAATGFTAVKELWSGETVKTSADKLDYSVPAKDAKIFRFQKSN